MTPDTLKETLALVETFQQQHPGKRVAIDQHGMHLVDATPEEEAAWQIEKRKAEEILAILAEKDKNSPPT